MTEIDFSFFYGDESNRKRFYEDGEILSSMIESSMQFHDFDPGSLKYRIGQILEEKDSSIVGRFNSLVKRMTPLAMERFQRKFEFFKDYPDRTPIFRKTFLNSTLGYMDYDSEYIALLPLGGIYLSSIDGLRALVRSESHTAELLGLNDESRLVDYFLDWKATHTEEWLHSNGVELSPLDMKSHCAELGMALSLMEYSMQKNS